MGNGFESIFNLIQTTFWGEDGGLSEYCQLGCMAGDRQSGGLAYSRIITARHDGRVSRGGNELDLVKLADDSADLLCY